MVETKACVCFLDTSTRSYNNSYSASALMVTVGGGDSGDDYSDDRVSMS